MKIDKPIWEEEINTAEDIELYQNTIFKKSIKCKNIICENDRWNIDAGNIDAGNIDAGNIDAGSIICEKRIKKSKKVKTISRVFVQNKSKLERKEQLKSQVEKT